MLDHSHADFATHSGARSLPSDEADNDHRPFATLSDEVYSVAENQQYSPFGSLEFRGGEAEQAASNSQVGFAQQEELQQPPAQQDSTYHPGQEPQVADQQAYQYQSHQDQGMAYQEGTVYLDQTQGQAYQAQAADYPGQSADDHSGYQGPQSHGAPQIDPRYGFNASGPDASGYEDQVEQGADGSENNDAPFDQDNQQYPPQGFPPGYGPAGFPVGNRTAEGCSALAEGCSC